MTALNLKTHGSSSKAPKTRLKSLHSTELLHLVRNTFVFPRENLAADVSTNAL